MASTFSILWLKDWNPNIVAEGLEPQGNRLV